MRPAADVKKGGPRWARLSHVVLAAALVAVGCAAACRSPGASGPTAQPALPTLRLYFVSGVAGALEPCGCVKDQLGGLDHPARR